MTNPPPVAPVVTDEMVDAGLEKWFESEREELAELKADSNFWNYYQREMRAAITAALGASGELERLRAANEKMKSALSYYADDGPLTPDSYGPWKVCSTDFGTVARCTLADVANIEGGKNP